MLHQPSDNVIRALLARRTQLFYIYNNWSVKLCVDRLGPTVWRFISRARLSYPVNGVP